MKTLKLGCFTHYDKGMTMLLPCSCHSSRLYRHPLTQNAVLNTHMEHSVMADVIAASSAHKLWLMRCGVQSALKIGGVTPARHRACMRQPMEGAAGLPSEQTTAMRSLLIALLQFAALAHERVIKAAARAMARRLSISRVL